MSYGHVSPRMLHISPCLRAELKWGSSCCNRKDLDEILGGTSNVERHGEPGPLAGRLYRGCPAQLSDRGEDHRGSCPKPHSDTVETESVQHQRTIYGPSRSSLLFLPLYPHHTHTHWLLPRAGLWAMPKVVFSFQGGQVGGRERERQLRLATERAPTEIAPPLQRPRLVL